MALCMHSSGSRSIRATGREKKVPDYAKSVCVGGDVHGLHGVHLAYVDISAPLFPDADMAEAGGNADLARVENDLLALVRSSHGLPSIRDKAAWEENAPLNVAAFDGMVGPCELGADAQPLPDWPRW